MTEIFDQIRKLYRFLPPQEALVQHVEFFSETNLLFAKTYIKEESFTVKLFPSFTPTIWMNLGSPYQLINGAVQHRVDQKSDVLVLRNEIIERCNAPTDNIFTVKFLPGGFEAIFGVSQVIIGSEVVMLEELVPASIISRIKQAPDFEERVKLWEEYLIERKSRNPESHYLGTIQRAINVFNDADMQLSVAQLADKLFMGEKSLNRYFNRVVGTGPKSYFNIYRARAAVTGFLIDQSCFLPQDYGYYDMSHFYRDAVNFTKRRFIEE